MSEFQQYQFKALDRPLTEAQRREVSSWSRRTAASATSATFVYHYGNYFPVSEQTALTEYFDAMLYITNWGTRRLIFRFPAGLVEKKALARYCIGHEEALCYVRLIQVKDQLLWTFNMDQEEYDEWVEDDDYQLADLTPLREQILNGDYRPLYLAWLRVAQELRMIAEYEEEKDWDLDSPPIPANLGRINAPLRALMDYFRIDEDWVAAAAGYSPNREKSDVDYGKVIRRLPEAERLDFLTRLAAGEPRLDLKFRKRLETLIGAQRPTAETVTIQQIIARSEGKREERIAEEKRREQAAHKQRMQAIADQEETLWEQVLVELDNKKGNAYARATDTLTELKETAAFFGKEEDFQRRLKAILEEYGGSVALMRRLRAAGVV